MADAFGGGTFGGGTFDEFDETTGGEVTTPISSGIAPVDTPFDQQDPQPEPELTSLAVRNEDLYFDDGGSFERVSGIDNVMQSVALDVRDTLQSSIGDMLTTDVVFELEQQIHNAMIADPQVTDPISVAATRVNRDTNELTFTVTVRDNEEFTVDMVLPE